MFGQNIMVNFRKTEKAPSNQNSDNGEFMLNRPSRALWIGNISPTVEDSNLLAAFSQFGEIESVRSLRAKTCAFVNFVKTEDAEAALQNLQGSVMGDLPIKINFGRLPVKKRGMGRPDEMPMDYYGGYMGAPYAPMPFMPNGEFPYQGYSYPMPGVGYNPQYPPMGYPPMFDHYGAPIYMPGPPPCDICKTNFREVLLVPCQHSSCKMCLSKTKAPQGDACPIDMELVTKIVELTYSTPPPLDPSQTQGPGPYLPPGSNHPTNGGF